jgi:hypothetical protein
MVVLRMTIGPCDGGSPQQRVSFPVGLSSPDASELVCPLLREFNDKFVVTSTKLGAQ